ncbi:MAG: hypothetical protein ACRDF9_14220 [Candidatus Limnocylindria bacterium]
MKTNENWIAEQARLLDLEEGFGPSYAPARPDVRDDAEDIAARPAA